MLHAPDKATANGGRPSDKNDNLADLMADPHCRYLVQCLREKDGTASLEAVSKYVVAEITGGSSDDVPDEVQRRVQTWLHHGQLPQLDNHGIVDFDPESGTVQLASGADQQWRVDAPGLERGP